MIKVDSLENRLRDMERELTRDYGFRIINHVPFMDTGEASTAPAQKNADEDSIRPDEHHKIAKNHREVIHMQYWAMSCPDDPAVQVRVHFSDLRMKLTPCRVSVVY